MDGGRTRLAALPWHVRLVVVLVDVLAAAAVGWSVLAEDDPRWLTCAVLAACGLVHVGLTDTIERVRHRDRGPTLDLCGVWTFACALLLPVYQTALVLAVLYTYLWCFTGGPHARRPPHRSVYSVATLVLGSGAASMAVVHTGLRDRLLDGAPLGLVDGVVVLGAIVLAWAVNTGLVGVVIALTAGRAGALGGRADNAIELGQLMLGVFLAFGVARWPWFAVLMVTPVVMLHRTMLLNQLRQAARTDDKTGLLNARAWREQAEAALARPGDLAVFMVDLDHFTEINNRYGHLAGDAVLREVAAMLTASVRRDDTVGRFGGEEFAVLLPGVGREQAMVAAERVRRRMRELSVPVDGAVVEGMTLSVGVAVRDASSTVDGLLKAADAALYRAKHAGRDQVCPPA